ncbi:MAG: hypothetical protein LBH58_03095 [Tannerellaceae bacterium]|jgi:hypothetical protein|nr:hypothetical protein [Tannerellaceae bacterium]
MENVDKSVEIDKRAETTWKKADVSYKNYQDYIKRKDDKFKLTLIDLLYISNFKGGNASIHEEEKSVNDKLKAYSEKLKEIEDAFKNSKLSDLAETETEAKAELETLTKVVDECCNLTKISSDTKIDGFSVSYLSALLNAYFSDLIPILDRRILINLEIVTKKDQVTTTDAIKDIQKYYNPLIRKMATLSKSNAKSIREIDEEYFKRKLLELK